MVLYAVLNKVNFNLAVVERTLGRVFKKKTKGELLREAMVGVAGILITLYVITIVIGNLTPALIAAVNNSSPLYGVVQKITDSTITTMSIMAIVGIIAVGALIMRIIY